MNVPALKYFCSSFPGAVETNYEHPSSILVYSVGKKKFAYFKTSEPELWRFSIRVNTDRFLELTDQPGVKPARYMGRFHWVTIVNVCSFDEGYLKELIAWSYSKALSGLSKKAQVGIESLGR